MGLVLLAFVISFIVGGVTWIKFFGNYHISGSNKLNVNAWHFRYLNWCFSWLEDSRFDRDDFRSLCSYSWILFGVITISPLLILFNGIAVILRFLSKHIDKLMIPIDRYCERQHDKWIANLTSDIDNDNLSEFHLKNITEIINLADGYNQTPIEFLESNMGWIRDENEEWLKYKEFFKSYKPITQSELKDSLLAKRAKLKSDAKAKKEASIKLAESRRESIEKFTNIGKWIVYVVTAGLGIYGLYWLAVLGVITFDFLVNDVDWVYTLQQWGDFGIWILKMILVLTVLIGVGYLLVLGFNFLWCRVFKYCLPCEIRREKWAGNIRSFFTTITIPFKVVAGGIVFTFKTIKAYKTDNCPMIEWEDE
jgi:DNA-binding protein H-NS